MTAELLRRAADRIEQLATGATPAPWTAVENYPDAWVVYGNQRWLASDRHGASYAVAYESNRGDIPPADAKWIAALGPQVAGPLAAWLRAEADIADVVDRRPDPIAELLDIDPDRLKPYGSLAYPLARVILGEQDR